MQTEKIEQGGKVEFNLLDTEIVFVSETFTEYGADRFTISGR